MRAGPSAGGLIGGSSCWRRWSAQNGPTLAKPLVADELGDSRNMIAKWFNPKATTNSRAFSAMAALAPRQADPQTAKEIAPAGQRSPQDRVAGLLV
mgnify:CR=1 FL=1